MVIFAILANAIFTLTTLSFRLVSYSRAKIAAQHLAQERLELIRNLAYEEVGTQGGIPTTALVTDFVLHPEVWEDIREIWDFIANDNPTAADRVEEELFHTFAKLAADPAIGHSHPHIRTSVPLRFFAVRSYLIAYDPRSRPVVVLGVIHGARDPKTIASILSGRG